MGKKSAGKKKNKGKNKPRTKLDKPKLHDDDLYGSSEELGEDARNEINQDRLEHRLTQLESHGFKPKEDPRQKYMQQQRHNNGPSDATFSALWERMTKPSLRDSIMHGSRLEKLLAKYNRYGKQNVPWDFDTLALDTDDKVAEAALESNWRYSPATASQATIPGDMDDQVIDNLYKKYVAPEEKKRGKKQGPAEDQDPASEVDMLRACNMTDVDHYAVRYRIGQAMSQLQSVEGVKSMKEYLEPGEYRGILSELYYELCRIQMPQNDRIDLNQLFAHCTVSTLPDLISARLTGEPRLQAPPPPAPPLEAGETKVERAQDKGDKEIGLYGWGHYLQPEMKRRQVMREMVFWYKLKLVSSRLDGYIAAKRWCDAKHANNNNNNNNNNNKTME